MLYVCHTEQEYIPYKKCTKFSMLPTRFPTQVASENAGNKFMPRARPLTAKNNKICILLLFPYFIQNCHSPCSSSRNLYVKFEATVRLTRQKSPVIAVEKISNGKRTWGEGNRKISAREIFASNEENRLWNVSVRASCVIYYYYYY